MSQRHPTPHQPQSPIAATNHQGPSEGPSPSAESQSSAQPPIAIPYPHTAAELRYHSLRIALSGRALHLILWLAAHDDPINGIASESGQLWLTWKGTSVAGEIHTRL